MQWLLFLSRTAFISNIFFLIAFSLRLSNWIQNEQIISTVIVIGYLLVALFNPVVNVLYVVLLIFARRRLKPIPLWLIVANALFLIMQIFYILYLNDTRYS